MVPATTGAEKTEVAALRARLEVLEAAKVPYSTEELALLKNTPPVGVTATSAAVKHTPKKLTPAAEKLRAEAERFFVAKQFDKAREKYLELLKLDDENVVVLGNLASTEFELRQLDDAEAHLKKALSLEPADAYNLKSLGLVKFEQKKYDEAVETLSRAAQIDPQDAITQNYLGLTLDAKGLRGPAETAYRKALQINPKYGAAHNNLAVTYVTQTPPMVELARWHYEKARANGQPANPALEKMLAAPGATETPK